MMHKLRVHTRERLEFVDITRHIDALVRESDVGNGTVHLFCPHTSCGLTIQENCDPGVQHDMQLLLERIAPRYDPQYRHNEDNSASHLQSSLMGASQMLFIEQGQLVLGRWQAIYLCEFDGPRERTVLAKIQPDVWSTGG